MNRYPHYAPTAPLHYVSLVVILVALLLWPVVCAAQIQIIDISPDRSSLGGNGATGGRFNGLASVAGNSQVYFGASEWGGVYKTIDSGRTWFRLNSHLPVATWDVEVDPQRTEQVYATSFYDGRVDSLAGINISFDGGDNWVHPESAEPPLGLCNERRRLEPAAFGIGIDPDDATNVYVGTNCGLAFSKDRGMTWGYVDPTPGDLATDVWDVVVHHGGIVDLCGDDGHLRSVDGGASWVSGTGLPSGTCSIAASPNEANVIFATVGNNVYESDDGGGSWTNLGTPDRRRQGRVPFVTTNPRSDDPAADFDLWFGDVGLFRATCKTRSPSSLRCPLAIVGPIPSPLPPLPSGWAGPFTTAAGAHDDVGDLIFNPESSENACPTLFASDGGIYVNQETASPACQTPRWEQPDLTPHALWLWTLAGADEVGIEEEALYAGAQDNGSFSTLRGGATRPSWENVDCCDVFDSAADRENVLYTFCCAGGRRTRLFLGPPGMSGSAEVNSYPPDGLIPGFSFPDVLDEFGSTGQYVIATQNCTTPPDGIDNDGDGMIDEADETRGCSGVNGGDGGVFVTLDVTANPIIWTELGPATEPPTGRNGVCAVKASVPESGVPTFYAQVGTCSGRNADQLWTYSGIDSAGSWQRVNLPSGGIGIFDVADRDPRRIYASNLSAGGGPGMIYSRDGGVTWKSDTPLDDLMTGGGVFNYQNQRGPTAWQAFSGYPQPTLVAFHPSNPDIIVAGGADSGVFLSTEGGSYWALLTDPINSGVSGIPHVSRPRFAYFDDEPTEQVNVVVGTQGRGMWRLRFNPPRFRFEYAAKIVCGIQSDPLDLRLTPGVYGTAINIHNPSDIRATFRKKLALTFPPEEQRPGQIFPLSQDLLGSDEALEVDCNDLQRKLFPDSLPAPYIKGFVVLKSTQSLDVTAVYTSASLRTDSQSGSTPLIGDHSSIDVERIHERNLMPSEIPIEERPDLVPIAPFPPFPPPFPSAFCEVEAPLTLAVLVRNQGPGPAGPTETQVNLTNAGRVLTLPTPPLDTGEEHLLRFIAPDSLGSTQDFVITVDVFDQQLEQDETNNDAESGCRREP